ncbi:unnamed protein product [Orchesella dallaii]|uniref:Uncharacterized protein n=1 Tax=Orchesella dallaii TaxID=48710 RepID=A0ABP1S8K6_9HEXA
MEIIQGSQNYQLRDVGPIDIPLVNSIYSYKKQLTSRGPWGVYCGNDRWVLEPNQGFLFNASVPLKLNCEIELYIPPMQCKSWRVNSRKPSRWTFILPPSHFDFHLNPKLTKSPEELYRVGRFFIYVSSHASTITSESMLNSVFLLPDHECQGRHCNYNLGSLRHATVFRTKLLFELEVFNDRYGENFNVSATYLVIHPSSQKLYETFLSTCKQHSGDATKWRRCGRAVVLYVKYAFIQYKLSDKRSPHEVEDSVGKLSQFTSNAWVIDCKNCWTFNGVNVEHIILQMFSPNSTIRNDDIFSTIIYPTFQIIEGEFKSPQLIQIENRGYHFVTCANPKATTELFESISRTSAFDSYTWFLVALFSIVSGVLLLLFIHFKEKDDQFGKMDLFAVFTFPVHLLMGQCVKMVKKCRAIGLGWLLASIILCESYKGDNIKMLCAPVPDKKFETFEELLSQNFTFYSNNYYQHLVDQFENNPTKDYVVRAPDEYFVDRYMYTSSFETFIIKDVVENGIEDKIRNWETILRINESLKRPQSQNETLEMGRELYFQKIVGKCEKDAYIDNYEMVTLFYLHLNAVLSSENARYLSVSKESLAKVKRLWKFHNVPWSTNYFVMRVHSLLASGLIDKWSQWVLHMLSIKSTGKVNIIGKHTKPLSLSDSISSVFYLYLLMLPSGIVIFLFERMLSLRYFSFWKNQRCTKILNT